MAHLIAVLDFPLKQNGNMFVVQVRQKIMGGQVGLEIWGGMTMRFLALACRRIPWAGSVQIAGVFLICTVMYGNGATIGMALMVVTRRIHMVQYWAQAESFAEAVTVATRGSVARLPVTAMPPIITILL